MKQLEMLYEGKAKQVFRTDDPEKIIIHYKDAATAFNNIKKATIENKGVLNNAISTLIFKELQKAGIKTHYIETINDRDQICRKVTIIPLEVIVRNIIAGSMAQRLGIEEGTQPSNTIYDICYKKDELGDPLINDHHAVALGAVTYDELDRDLRHDFASINEVLRNMFAKMNINLVDFKIEFGRTSDGEIVLADEVSPDTCRLWDMSRPTRNSTRTVSAAIWARCARLTRRFLPVCRKSWSNGDGGRSATGSCMRSAVCSASSGCPTLHR